MSATILEYFKEAIDVFLADVSISTEEKFIKVNNNIQEIIDNTTELVLFNEKSNN